jgi:GNAT superfamily N-acetyltransferase
MTNPIEYRQAVREDEDALAGIWWTMQASHHAYEPRWYADKGQEACEATWRERFRCLLRDDRCIIVVAACSGTPVGMIVAQFTDRPRIYVIDKVVAIASTAAHPDHRGQGVFRGMLSFLEEKACDAGIKVMKLSVHAGNPAQRAYKRTGFVPETMGMIKWIG